MLAETPDTAQLIEQATRGDGQARHDLLVRHQSRLRQMVVVRMDRQLAARVDPSDVVQDALAEAHRTMGDYLRSRPLPFYPWLRRLAWERQAVPREPTDPVAEISMREMCAIVDYEVQALPAACRAPLVLCYLEGKTRDEAAQQLGWTVSTVKGRLERGREMLRRRLTRRGVTLNARMSGHRIRQR